MYLDQLMRIFPREFTAKLKLTPAFEETFMKYEELRGTTKGGAKA